MTSVKTNKKGFTLVELVVVIAILAILAAIAIPVVNSVINTATKNGALTNANSIELAIKDAQADIASRNTETYGSAVTTNGGKDITVQTVADKKALKDAFEPVNYKGEIYTYWWSLADQKVYVVDKTKIRIEDAGNDSAEAASVDVELKPDGEDIAEDSIVDLAKTSASTTP